MFVTANQYKMSAYSAKYHHLWASDVLFLMLHAGTCASSGGGAGAVVKRDFLQRAGELVAD